MDSDALDHVSQWLTAHVPGATGRVTATKFDVGQSNPTFRLSWDGGACVLRRKPPGQLLKSAHAVDREFRVQRALAGTEVPVPKMLAYCDDKGVIGSEFYVMEEVAGEGFEDPRLPDKSPGDRAAMFADMARVLAAIHEVDLTATGLQDYGPEGDYIARQLARWTKQYRATETEAVADMDALIAWLDANAPAADGQRTLVHGDYRLDNLLFAPGGTGIVAVLDWELSTIGHPFADLAAVIMQWQMPPGAEGRGLSGVDRAALGLPCDAEFIDTYCAHRGLGPIPEFNAYLAFAFFRMAAILQGVKKRALDGNASNPEQGLRMGAYVPEFARAGLRAAQGDGIGA